MFNKRYMLCTCANMDKRNLRQAREQKQNELANGSTLFTTVAKTRDKLCYFDPTFLINSVLVPLKVVEFLGDFVFIIVSSGWIVLAKTSVD